jgi:hypothetical protein
VEAVRQLSLLKSNPWYVNLHLFDPELPVGIQFFTTMENLVKTTFLIINFEQVIGGHEETCKKRYLLNN